MSALSRFGCSVLRSSLVSNQRHMASAATINDPIQKLFLDKVKDFKSSNKGLDESHQRMLADEMARLKRVYKVDDVNKLPNIDANFSSEASISLRDIDEFADERKMIASGEMAKQLDNQISSEVSPLLSTIPPQGPREFDLPRNNKPDLTYIYENQGVPRPCQVGDVVPDYMYVGDLMTPKQMMRQMRVNFGPNMPTIHDDKDPQRDTENFPRLPYELHYPPRRYHIIPESWFRFFYPKTGVTGPYAFAATFTTFLLSKEWIPIEHEILTGFTTTIIFTYAVLKFGPKISAYYHKDIDETLEGWEKWQKGNHQYLSDIQKHYADQIKKVDMIEDLYELRKKDIELQLEQERRTRIHKVYEDTKRRLNYLVSVSESNRQIAQRNMVNWVIDSARNSFGPKQESEVLESCITNLRSLANKNSNII